MAGSGTPLGARLLLIATGIDRRGAESHVLGLGRGFAARGWQVHLAYWGGSGELAPEFREAEVTVHRLPFRGKLNPLSLGPFVRLVRAVRPDVVHTHLPLAEFYGNLAAAICRVPTIVSTKHSDHAIFMRPLVRVGHALMSAPNASVIAVSEYMARFIRGVGLWPGTRLVAIPNGLDVTAFDRASSPKQIAVLRSALVSDGQHLIGAAGRLEPEKGFDVLIDAMAQVVAREPAAKLVIAGSGSRRHELQGQIDGRGLSASIRLLGPRPDLYTLMHAFDLFALSSRSEPFGLVLLEAMAARQAIVATNAGGAPEVVVGGQTGTLVPSGDATAMADALLALLRDRERAEAYGWAGRQRVEDLFAMERMLAETEAVYLGKPSTAPRARPGGRPRPGAAPPTG
jgi:glycosyltransferase involved in cell wall biosynthesis